MIEALPEDHAVGYKAQESNTRDGGEDAEEAHRYHAMT